MDAKEFAEFYRLQGHKVLQSESCFWYEASTFFYQAIPYHVPIHPSREELRKVFFGGRAIGVRYAADSGSGGKESYIWVRDERRYDLQSVEQKARNQTKRGLEKCRIEKISFDRLERDGLPLVRDTLIRQGRNPHTVSTMQWELLCRASAEQPDFEAWGALIDNKLAAFLVAGSVERCYYILHQYSDSGLLQHYPNNALIFTVTKNALADSSVDYVSYGIQSLDMEHTQGLESFKERMGYVKKPIEQCVRFNPLARRAFGRLTYRLVRGIRTMMPGSDFVRKLNGILCYYAESKPVKEYEKP